MLRTAGSLALPRRALSAGFDGGLSPSFQFVAAQLLGGWDLTEARLSLVSSSELLWTHRQRVTPASAAGLLEARHPDPHLTAAAAHAGVLLP
jgi:hypothetical protein